MLFLSATASIKTFSETDGFGSTWTSSVVILGRSVFEEIRSFWELSGSVDEFQASVCILLWIFNCSLLPSIFWQVVHFHRLWKSEKNHDFLLRCVWETSLVVMSINSLTAYLCASSYACWDRRLYRIAGNIPNTQTLWHRDVISGVPVIIMLILLHDLEVAVILYCNVRISRKCFFVPLISLLWNLDHRTCDTATECYTPSSYPCQKKQVSLVVLCCEKSSYKHRTSFNYSMKTVKTVSHTN